MTVKDIIEKLEGDTEFQEYMYPKNGCMDHQAFFDGRIIYINNILKWIKSNLEESK